MLKRIENWLFYIFLFSIPISTRYIFGYQPFNYIEWTAKYIYAIDVLLLILFLFWFEATVWSDYGTTQAGAGMVSAKADERRPSQRQKFLAGKFYGVPVIGLDWSSIFLLAFVAVAGISIKNAMDVGTAWFRFAKLVEFVLLYFYVKNYALKRFDLSHCFTALVLGGLFQSVIAIPQFMLQSSLGLKWLGESYLAPAMSGIAAFYVNGVKIMRAYGTTPHSNVLAAYFFIALGAFYSIAIYQKRRWWWFAAHALTLWAFLLTFSRVILGIWILNFLARIFLIRYSKFKKEFYEDPEMRRRSLKIFWTTIAVGVVFLVVYWPYVASRAALSGTDQAVQLRVYYNHESLVSAHNLFGLGMGNFVPWLMSQDQHLSSDLYQPVHNIYLLIYSETGIVGISLFLLFLVFLLYDYWKKLGFKKLYHFSFGLIVCSILIFGLFDHYLWDIQSGQMIFWLSLGLLAGAQ
ncbi:MAG TPA: O-antigen ligase family protein [Candidatus Paceibacterota bacterium]|nr:O-antigen ligase family protein [Candidatus Paceibacterota bacterium]